MDFKVLIKAVMFIMKHTDLVCVSRKIS